MSNTKFWLFWYYLKLYIKVFKAIYISNLEVFIIFRIEGRVSFVRLGRQMLIQHNLVASGSEIISGLCDGLERNGSVFSPWKSRNDLEVLQFGVLCFKPSLVSVPDCNPEVGKVFRFEHDVGVCFKFKFQRKILEVWTFLN